MQSTCRGMRGSKSYKLFDAYDCLSQSIGAEINGGELSPQFQIATQIVLANLDDKIGHFVIAGQKFSIDPVASLDVVRLIFEVDVAQSLARLAGVLIDPGLRHILVGEFRAQLEVFTGIASLTNLPGFGVLTDATIAALDRHPDRTYEICTLALNDFYTALATVLTGNRDTCGRISPQFAALIAAPIKSPLVPIGVGDPRHLFDSADLCGAAPAGGGLLPAIGAEVEVDFVLEDILANRSDLVLAPTEQFYHQRSFDFLAPQPDRSGDFDLEDIFDLAAVGMATGAVDFDLVDIFDLPSLGLLTPNPGTWAGLSELADLNFDLADMFDLPPDRGANLDLTTRQRQIETIVAEAIANFDKFAPINPSTFTAPPKIRPVKVKKSRKVTTSSTAQLSIRVSLDRLERMNNLMGELAIERNGLALANEQSTAILHQLQLKCTNFQAIGDKLQQIADTLAISIQHPATRKDDPALLLNQDLDTQFDPLELDRYTEVHQIAQATIEQIAQIEEQIEDLALFATQSHRQIDRQKQLFSHLRDDLMWARMLPLGEILNRFPRTLHDLSIEFNKPVDLKITGAGVLVDRAAIDKLLDPLVHLLRNAFDHGIDLPAVRQAMHKPERGSIEITAYHQGSQTVIEITDDGRGIDLAKIRAKAIALELLTPGDAAAANQQQLFDLLFTPGFSTADRVTKLSGRGMGLDIVKEQIQAIKGTISIDSQLGRGTTFTLRIPLTLTIAQLMICQVGNAVYAFPADSIQKIVVPISTQLAYQDSQLVFYWQNLTIPVYKLTDLLTYSIPVPERTLSYTLKSSADNPEDWLSPLLLIRRGNRLIALEIDRLITEQELTIKPFGAAITPPSYSYGCTILGDGIILPVLDPHTLIQVLIERPLCPLKPTPANLVSLSKSILVVDDSITTRQSLCLSLEKFGYRPLQAKDGQEALQVLRQKASEIDLVVCDVEMPNLNGFEFLNIYRQDPTISGIPVVMLTSRSNAKHRQFAAHLGAVDYFIKPYVEQDFMSAINQIITDK